MTHNRAKLLVVVAATLVAVYLSARLSLPFLPALVWAATAAVIAQPVVRVLDRQISWRPLVAMIATALAAVVLFVPAIGLMYFIALEIADVMERGPGPDDYAAILQQKLAGIPYVGAAWQQFSANINLPPTFERLTVQMRTIATDVVAGFFYTLI